jgi:predicted Zn-dependent protease
VPKTYKHQSPPHFWRKLALQVAVAILILVAICFAAYFGYGAWRKSALLKEARAHFAKNDYTSALLTARRVIELDPAHDEANILAADITDKAGHPDSVEWRQRVLELNPKDPARALAWARTAVKFGKFSSAQAALDAVPAAARAQAGYQQLAGGVAVGLGRPQDAGKFYAEALRLEPGKEQNVFNHANWTLQFDKDAARRAEAEAALTKLTASKEFGEHAHRALLNAAAEGRRWDVVRIHGAALTRGAAANDADWAQYLEALWTRKDAALETELARAKAAAVKKPLLAVVMIRWLNDHDRAGEVLAWVATLDKEVASDPNVASATAASLDAAKKWKELRDLARAGSWKDKESLRFAYSARAARELEDPLEAMNNWTAAVAAAKTIENANQLMLRAVQWGWRQEAEELLWKRAEGPTASWALGALHRLYQTDKNADGLLRVAMALTRLEPANDAAQNNVAALSLLLDRDVSKAASLAAELYARHPKSIGIASTHALALFKLGRSDQAVKVLEPFKPEELRHPSIAPTYGVVLASAGRKEAKEFLTIAEKAPLLPEEKSLVQKALSAVDAGK